MAIHPKFKGLSICSGVGGIELGLQIAIRDYKTVAYIERESYAAATLVARMEDSSLDKAPVWDDLKTFNGKPWRGKVDIITAGYPCQPFSVAGQRGGETDERYIWPDVYRIISEVRPYFVFLENVPGHLTIGFDRTLADLTALGFDSEWDTFRASNCGASQRRERLFCLAYSRYESKHLQQRKERPKFKRESCELANSKKRRQRTLRRTPRTNRRLDGSDSTMANPESIKRERCQQKRNGSGKSEGKIRNRSKNLGNTDDKRSQGLRFKHYNEKPTWPPSPTDTDSWRKVLEINPALEPAVCRVADGMAPWVDRLRACGNGVVPVCAALAFTTLRERLNDSHK